MAEHPTYRRFRALCLALPETQVTMTWGAPHLRVGDKIFTGWSRWPDDDGWSFNVKLDKEQQAALVASDPRFAVAPYVGKHGWVAVAIADGTEDWREIAALVEEGYRNVAGPKRAALIGPPAKQPPAKPLTTKQPPAKKSPTKQLTTKKPLAKKPPTKQPLAKKSPTKKPLAKKPPAPKPARRAASPRAPKR